ncbi:speckle-type POZ protein-like [Musca autumnalis]|uniref:speckle-type POZ protein-like n=1 Tax=Musca autumnalis TaxID=221902 RepID=UPI003CE76C77
MVAEHVVGDEYDNVEINIALMSASVNDTVFQVEISSAEAEFNTTKKIRTAFTEYEHFLIGYDRDDKTDHEIKVVIKPLYNTVLRSSLTKDLANILTSKEFSDVTLVARDGTEFKAHKALLSARSQVFAAMFRIDMEESKTSRISIDDIKPKVIEEMLKYMYTAAGDIPKKLAAELFIAANKYSLLDLQTLCEDILIETMDVFTVADILLLADRHANERLKTSAVQYITKNIKEVTTTKCWKKLRQTDHELCMDILKKTIQERS